MSGNDLMVFEESDIALIILVQVDFIIKLKVV